MKYLHQVDRKNNVITIYLSQLLCEVIEDSAKDSWHFTNGRISGKTARISNSYAKQTAPYLL